MKYLVVPETNTDRQLPFYFAVEEYAAQKYTDDELFFIWSVDPTVMLGRNQLMENEVNVEYCKSHGVHIFRRKSGGGCVYSDRGCLQFSYITNDIGVNYAFGRYMNMVADVLRQAGIKAEATGRNDIVVDGKKVAGTAFYRLKRRSVLHNTLLFDTNLEELVKSITPSDDKLISKGVQSVSQRVTNVGEHTDMSIDDLVAFVREKMCGGESITLTEADLEAVAELEKELASDEFVYGKNPKFTLHREARLREVGKMDVSLEIKNNTILNMNIVGDFFLISDLDRELVDKLKGVRFTREAVEEALANVDLGNIVRGLNLSRFLKLLFGRKPHVPKPEWLKISIASKNNYAETQGIISDHKLHTICSSGLCPNRAECWGAGTATLMIGGEICTRSCKFCNTLSGKPKALDPQEPMRVAESVRKLRLKYAVITSVDRDDLPDYGAAHWVDTIECVRKENPDTTIEVLIPDFMGDEKLLDMVIDARPDVVGHNMETVRRLTPGVRSVATYERSLQVLRRIAERGLPCKTGFMVGLGETEEEIYETMDDILRTGCRRLTVGQYLQPSYRHLPVERYVTPQEFDIYKKVALEKGFKHVESGPLVRSSYHAESWQRKLVGETEQS